MIETVYNNENGEANRTGRVQPSFKMPKNIRQVGKSNAARKIYVEDYVMSFIKQLAGEDFSGYKAAVLVGQNVKQDGCRSLFIHGAVEAPDVDVAGEILFSNDTWTTIYENIKKYFVEAEILGWFLGGPGYLLEEKERILKAHIDNFAGADKTLLTYDNMEKEEAFYCYENNRLVKQEGYYIYYEKNEEMQTYIIDHNKPVSSEEEYDDRVSREIRTVIQNKKPASVQENKSVTRLMYAAGTLLAVIILVVGAAMLSNYDQMKNMQKALDSLSRNLEEVESVFVKGSKDPASKLQGEAARIDLSQLTGNGTKESGESLDVTVVPGELKPLEEEKSLDQENPPADRKDEKKAKDAKDVKDTDTGEKKDTKQTASDENDETKDVKDEKEIKYYTVVSGDSLLGISYKLYNSANYAAVIKKLNNIEDENMIYIGQKLIVP